MDVFGSLFNNAISSRVSKQIAQKQSSAFASALTQINITLNEGLPTLNPDTADYYQTFKTIGAVYEVTDAICKKVLNCPFVFYKITNKKKLQQSKALFKTDPVQAHILKAQSIEEVDVPDLNNILTRGAANPYQTGSQVMWTIVLSYLLNGNTYMHATRSGKKAKQLWCFPNMKILADNQDLLDPIRGYELQNLAKTKFDIEEVQHVKTGNPAPIDIRMEYLYGVSPLRAYLEPIRSIKEGKEQASKQAKNGGVFGVLSPRDKEDNLTSDQKKQLKDKMIEARRSDDELSRVFPSSIALAWQNIGLPIGDLKLLELVSASEKDVYRAYHWPLNFHDQEGNTFSNQGMATKQAIYDAVAPVCDVVGEALTMFLAPGYGIDVIELDYTQLPEMAVNMGEVATYLNSLPKGVLTYNEMRAILRYGEKSEAYMNEHYVDATLTTLKRVFDGTNIAPSGTPPANDAPTQ